MIERFHSSHKSDLKEGKRKPIIPNQSQMTLREFEHLNLLKNFRISEIYSSFKNLPSRNHKKHPLQSNPKTRTLVKVTDTAQTLKKVNTCEAPLATSMILEQLNTTKQLLARKLENSIQLP